MAENRRGAAPSGWASRDVRPPGLVAPQDHHADDALAALERREDEGLARLFGLCARHVHHARIVQRVVSVLFGLT